MGLYAVKPWFVGRLRPVEDRLVAAEVSPDALTAASVAVSVAAGGALAVGGALGQPLLWLAVPPLVLVRLALNALDGSVARRTRRARPFGAALNEIGDRIGDAAMIGAGAVVAPPVLAVGAVAGSYLASVAGVTAHAVAGARDNGGPVGKADRAAIVAAGALAAGALGSAVPLVIALWAIVVGSLVTVVARLHRLRRAVEHRPHPSFEPELVEIPGASEVEEEMLYAVGR